MSKFDFLDRFNRPPSLDVDVVAIESFAAEIGGEILTNEFGRFLLLSTVYPSGFSHGTKSLATIFSRELIDISYYDHKSASERHPLADFVFVDAETTGLSAASGTVAFLVGVAVVDDDRFTVHQFFLPDYPDEPAMLDAIAEIVEDRKIVVSFNGKCFDLPLLETRYAMQKLATPFRGMHHIDLLHVCRRFWKGRFDDSTLQTLERELLCAYRQNDTPGFMIPQLYFDYLRHGQSGPLEGVLLHNRLDIVTLLFLLDAVHQYLDNAEKFNYYSPLDALRISKFHHRRGNAELARQAAACQLANASADTDRLSLCQHAFRLQKQLGRYDEALETLRFLAAAKGETRLVALNESAKILEHKMRVYDKAAQTVLMALEYLDSPLAEIPYDRVSFWNETLQKRRQRLLKRLS
ncbi:MAG: ribonuclease H-like domain-containing protein [Candidatus Zixiibacteriota bacterium]